MGSGGKGGGVGADGGLSDEIMQAIAAVMAPLSAAIDALDAKYECNVAVRLEGIESRISGLQSEQERVQDRETAEREKMIAQKEAETKAQQQSAWGAGPEQREAALKEVTQAQNAAAEALSAVRNEMLDAQSSVEAVRNEMG